MSGEMPRTWGNAPVVSDMKEGSLDGMDEDTVLP